MLILVDSGVLLRLMERADPQHGTIRQAVRTLTARGDELVAAIQNVAEFWNVCTRPATSRGGLGLDVGETDRRLRVLERILTILADPSGRLPVVAATRRDARRSGTAGSRRPAGGPDAGPRDHAHPDAERVGLHPLPRHHPG